MSTIKWIIDPTHSEVAFKVKHLVISTVTGYFRKFEGQVESSTEDFANASVSFQLEVGSIDTNQSDRDGHLKSADFFDADNFPKISFVGKLAHQGGNYQLLGGLTMKGITQSVILEVTYGGTVADPYGQTKAGFELEGKLNRKDFGLTWSAVTEAGSVVVSDQVRLQLSVQLVKQ
ncbi:MAG: YceI family protein [Bacteroidetes bacterium]|nr:YceI family protein [Bacteroidota bacterium]